MHPTLKQVDSILIVGISVRTKNQNELKTDTAKIPALWAQFFIEDIGGKIPNQIQSSPVYGVYSSYESDRNGEYTVTAGKGVSTPNDIPQNLAVVSIKKGRYLVFEDKGPMPGTVIKLWKEIWTYFSSDREVTRQYTTDFELYKGSDEIAIHIAVS